MMCAEIYAPREGVMLYLTEARKVAIGRPRRVTYTSASATNIGSFSGVDCLRLFNEEDEEDVTLAYEQLYPIDHTPLLKQWLIQQELGAL